VTDPTLQPPTRRARLWQAAEARRIPLRAILATVGVVVLVYLAAELIDRLRGVLLLLVVAGFIALLLNPLVVALQRVLRRRGLAVAVVTLLAVLAFAGLATAFGYPLIDGMTHLAKDLPTYLRRTQRGQGGWLGHLVARYHLQTWVERNAPKLVGYARDLGKPALSLGKGAVSLIFSLLTVFVLVILMLLEASKLRVGLLRLMAPDTARRYTAIAGQVSREVTGFMVGDLATSVIAGGVVLLSLLILGVPFAFLWALWVALVDFLPMIGGALAGIPVVLFAFTHSVTAGIVTAVVFLVYTQVENHVLNPLIMSRTVRINPLLVLVSILVGASIGSWVGGLFGGFVAALLAIPVAGALQVIVREVWQSTAVPITGTGGRRTGPTPLTDSAERTAGAEAGALQVIVREVWQSSVVPDTGAGEQATGRARAVDSVERSAETDPLSARPAPTAE
jgi:predicted PurR-regulated permease PerM